MIHHSHLSALSMSLVALSLSGGAFGQNQPAKLPYAQPDNIIQLRAQYGLTSDAETMLRTNGFVVLDSNGRTDLEQCYSRRPGDHTYITTSAMLEIWSELAVSLQRNMETGSTAPKLKRAIDALDAAARTELSQPHSTEAQRAIKSAALLLAVDKALGDGAQSADPDVAAVLKAIADHQAEAGVPVDDYTQYTVRGYYADTPDLSRYFLQSMWLSRQFGATSADEGSDLPLQKAIALAAILKSCPDGRTTLKEVNAARQLVNGQANAVSTEQLIGALETSLGANWKLDNAIEPASLAMVRKELSRDIYPHTVVATIGMPPNVKFSNQIAALLPDYITPDAAFTQTVINPAIPGRSLPTGLDIGLILGFSSAASEIKATYPQSTANAVIAASAAGTASVAQTRGFYGDWLRVLGTLSQADSKAPDYMHSAAWDYASLNGALTGWAQLRHTYLLSASQPYSETHGLESYQPEAEVEPNPIFFHQLGALATEERDALSRNGNLTPKLSGQLQAFIAFCSEFEADARAELTSNQSDDQGKAINEFGSQLARLELESSPIIADVATGENGEVLHIGTGAFYPIIVMPAKTGGAYIGWTSSYYELIKPNGQRITDADWQSTQGSQDSRPDRPTWVSNFAATDRGADWQARSGLRSAEQLFLTGKAVDAIAALRTQITANPDSTISTEAQLRIGKYYLDQNDYAKATDELQKCNYLPGCDAFDEAGYLIQYIQQKTERQDRSLNETQKTQNSQFDSLLSKLASTAATDPARSHLEAKLVSVVAGIAGDDGASGVTAKIDKALSSCKSPVYRDILTYLRVSTDSFPSSSPDSMTAGDIYLASSKISSPSVRAAMVAMALERGYLADKPDSQVALILPYVDRYPFKSDAASDLITQLTADRRISECYPPNEAFSFAMNRLRESIISWEFEKGDCIGVLHVAKELPADPQMQGDADTLVTTLRSIPPADYAVYKQFTALERAPYDTKTAGQYLKIAQANPHFKFANTCLECAESIYRDLKDDKDADAVLAVIKTRTPSFSLLTLRAAQKAAATGNIVAARKLMKGFSGSDIGQNNARYSAFEQGDELIAELAAEESIREAVRPFLNSQRWSSFVTSMHAGTPKDKIADQLIELNPDKAPLIYKALSHSVADNPDFRRAPDSTQFLLDYLRTCPDLSATGEIFQNGQPEAWIYGMPLSGLSWLIDLVNRGRSYRYADQVAAIFTGAFTNDPRFALEQLKLVQQTWPNTRAEALAINATSAVLVQSKRPEQAMELLREPTIKFVSVDPVRQQQTSLLQQAADIVAAKHKKPWAPIWTAKLPVVPDFMANLDTRQTLPIDITPDTILIPVAVTSTNTTLYALSVSDGTLKWSFPKLYSCVVSADQTTVYMLTADKHVSAVNSSNGSTIWSVGQPDLGGADTMPVMAAAGSNLVLVSNQGSDAALDLKTGKTIWKKTWMEGSYGSQLSPMIATGTRAIFSDPEGKLIALDSDTGSALWDQPLGGEDRDGMATNLSVTTNKKILALRGAKLDILDPATGRIEISIDNPQFGTFPNDVTVDGSFWIQWDFNGQNAIGDTSTLKTSKVTPGEINSELRPVISNGIAYYSTRDDNGLHAIDLSNGAEIGDLVVDTRNGGAAAASPNIVVLELVSGEVLALPALK